MGQPKKFNERARAIEWFSEPSNVRVPKTQQELEKEIGVAPARTSKWLQDSDFMDELTKRVREKAIVKHGADVANRTIEEAKGGNQQAVTNYYKYIAQTAEKSEHKITGKVSDVLGRDE